MNNLPEDINTPQNQVVYKNYSQMMNPRVNMNTILEEVPQGGQNVYKSKMGASEPLNGQLTAKETRHTKRKRVLSPIRRDAQQGTAYEGTKQAGRRRHEIWLENQSLMQRIMRIQMVGSDVKQYIRRPSPAPHAQSGPLNGTSGTRSASQSKHVPPNAQNTADTSFFPSKFQIESSRNTEEIKQRNVDLARKLNSLRPNIVVNDLEKNYQKQKKYRDLCQKNDQIRGFQKLLEQNQIRLKETFKILQDNKDRMLKKQRRRRERSDTNLGHRALPLGPVSQTQRDINNSFAHTSRWQDTLEKRTVALSHIPSTLSNDEHVAKVAEMYKRMQIFKNQVNN